MYCTRQIKKKVLFFYFYFKANPIIWWTGVKKYNPSPSKLDTKKVRIFDC